ncbi:hypothetical protein TNCV_1719041 [Trichonephila clavipes]|nr:hypothetical protein TNCV_1719041 [Trichonephila clavipes]
MHQKSSVGDGRSHPTSSDVTKHRQALYHLRQCSATFLLLRTGGPASFVQQTGTGRGGIELVGLERLISCRDLYLLSGKLDG